MIWHIPAHDPRLETMSDYEYRLEVEAWFEAQQILSGKKKAGPGQGFFDKAQEAQEALKRFMERQEEPVTPEELGWDK